LRCSKSEQSCLDFEPLTNQPRRKKAPGPPARVPGMSRQGLSSQLADKAIPRVPLWTASSQSERYAPGGPPLLPADGHPPSMVWALTGGHSSL
jgi:hypothetical protein